ncbi:XdhC family protein [Alteribacillus sp. YIM 98480]|uniref:XdhC family protein n=1 Tax=Alteribacillus sp. YIM 98480 TaxID=2606599 RepID=UPI00131BBD0C|nr:XdhC family protein [Alteribacillus sp. YIM 98480]
MMSDIPQILKTITDWQKDGHRLALATVVGIKGSAYRRPGARMVIADDGKSFGMIGGGCFDADVNELAQQVIDTGTPQLHLYDLQDADVWGLGLGCNGSVFVLIESLMNDTGKEWVTKVEASLEDNQPIHVTHTFSKELTFDLFFRNGEVELSRDFTFESENKRNIRNRTRQFHEVISPSPRLVIFGAGHDAIPLVEFASQSGFKVVVVDQRKHLLTHSRFPKAESFIHSRQENYEETIIPRPNDYVLFMSHNIHQDAAAFNLYREHQVKYLGFLGPKRRTKQIIEDILQLPSSDLESIRHVMFSPVGLDIGSETAEQVALSITAELMAVKNKSQPQFLKDKAGTIHEPQPT